MVDRGGFDVLDRGGFDVLDRGGFDVVDRGFDVVVPGGDESAQQSESRRYRHQPHSRCKPSMPKSKQ